MTSLHRESFARISVLNDAEAQFDEADHDKSSGGYDEEVTPVPIPNTAVKLLSAQDTWLVTTRENRSLPDLYSSIAQLVEHAAVNRRVVGSSPT